MGSLTLECVRGDIACQPDIEVIVNAANAQLMPGAGVAGAIHRAAGPDLARACHDLAPIRPGQAVITAAFGLPNRHVIHCLGPVYGVDEPAPQLLADCYRHAVLLADHHGLRSIAFPAISTGVFGYPFWDAAEVALSALGAVGGRLSNLSLVRFVLYSDSDLEVYRQLLSRDGDNRQRDQGRRN